MPDESKPNEQQPQAAAQLNEVRKQNLEKAREARKRKAAERRAAHLARPSVPSIHVPQGLQHAGTPLSRQEMSELDREKGTLEALRQSRPAPGTEEFGSRPDPYFTQTVDMGEVQNRLAKIDQIQGQRMPEEASAVRKNAIKGEIQKLEEHIREGMLSVNEYFPTKESMRSQVGLVGPAQRHRRWEDAKKPAILRWKRLRQELDPKAAQEDANWLNVECLRPGRPGTVGLGTRAAKTVFPGFDDPALSERDLMIRRLRNVAPEIVAESAGIPVEEVLRIQGKEVPVTA